MTTDRPAAVSDRLNADIARVMSEPEVKERLDAVGFTAWPGSTADLKNTLEADHKAFGVIAKKTKIELQ